MLQYAKLRKAPSLVFRSVCLALMFRITAQKPAVFCIILLQKSYTCLSYESKHCNFKVLYNNVSCLPNEFVYNVPVRLSLEL
jgi:hypothetical protein